MQRTTFGQEIGIVATIDPDATTVGVYTSDWVEASKFADYAAIVQVGALGGGASVDVKLRQATNASGSGEKNVQNKFTGSMNVSDREAMINLHPSELDLDSNYTHFALEITVTGATSDVSGIVLGRNPRVGTPERNGLSSVLEIVN